MNKKHNSVFMSGDVARVTHHGKLFIVLQSCGYKTHLDRVSTASSSDYFVSGLSLHLDITMILHIMAD